MPTRVLARVYLTEGRNMRVPTTPGRSVQFFGGCAQVVDGRDMPHMLQMEGARVQPEPEAMPWAPEWLRATDQIKAEVVWPTGYRVYHHNRDDWRLVPPRRVKLAEEQAIPPEPQLEPAEVSASSTPPPGSWVGGIRPEDLLADPDAP